MWLKLCLLLMYITVLFLLARLVEALTWYETGSLSRRLLDPMTLSVAKLKALLEQRGVSYDAVVEKAELTQLVEGSGRYQDQCPICNQAERMFCLMLPKQPTKNTRTDIQYSLSFSPFVYIKYTISTDTVTDRIAPPKHSCVLMHIPSNSATHNNVHNNSINTPRSCCIYRESTRSVTQKDEE